MWLCFIYLGQTVFTVSHCSILLLFHVDSKRSARLLTWSCVVIMAFSSIYLPWCYRLVYQSSEKWKISATLKKLLVWHRVPNFLTLTKLQPWISSARISRKLTRTAPARVWTGQSIIGREIIIRYCKRRYCDTLCEKKNLPVASRHYHRCLHG